MNLLSYWFDLGRLCACGGGCAKGRRTRVVCYGRIVKKGDELSKREIKMRTWPFVLYHFPIHTHLCCSLTTLSRLFRSTPLLSLLSTPSPHLPLSSHPFPLLFLSLSSLLSSIAITNSCSVVRGCHALLCLFSYLKGTLCFLPFRQFFPIPMLAKANDLSQGDNAGQGVGVLDKMY